MPHAILIIILLCLWAIALEVRLRQRDAALDALVRSIVMVADNKARAYRDSEGVIKIQPNKGVD